MPATITPLQKPKQASRNLTQEIENALPIVRGIQTAIGIEIGSVEISTNLFGHLFQCLQALR